MIAAVSGAKAAAKAYKEKARREQKAAEKIKNELYDTNVVRTRGAKEDVLSCFEPCLSKFELPANLGNPFVQKPDYESDAHASLDMLLIDAGKKSGLGETLSHTLTRGESMRFALSDELTLVLYGSTVHIANTLGLPPHIIAYVRLGQIRTSVLNHYVLTPFRQNLWRELNWIKSLTRLIKSITPGGAEYTDHTWLRPGCITPAQVLAVNFPDWAERNNVEPRIPLAKVRLPSDIKAMISEALSVAALVAKKNTVYEIGITK
jgi:hypothetical protein